MGKSNINNCVDTVYIKKQRKNRQSQATQSKTKAVMQTARDWKQSLCYPSLLYAITMKKSTVLFIALFCSFVSLAWAFDYPYRYALLIYAVRSAIISLILTLKGNKQ